MTPPLIDALEARNGVVCFVGAGGKKTLMFHVADCHPGRVAITATARIERFPKRYRHALVIEDEQMVEQVLALRAEPVVAFAHPCEKNARHGGVNEEEVARIVRDGGFDVCLVKADGARGRLIKAPAEHEPPIPRDASVVVAIVSAQVIGRPLSLEVAHRPERVAEITGAVIGHPIAPEHVARLLASTEGSLKGVGRCTVIPVINMVDDAEREQLARQVAERALAMTDRFDRVVLTAMRREQPLIAMMRSRP